MILFCTVRQRSTISKASEEVEFFSEPGSFLPGSRIFEPGSFLPGSFQEHGNCDSTQPGCALCYGKSQAPTY